MRISKHAIDRYIERYPDWTGGDDPPSRSEAEAKISHALATEPSEIVTPPWLNRPKPVEDGTRFVHLHNHCLVLAGDTVVTVLSKGCVTRLRQELGKKPFR